VIPEDWAEDVAVDIIIDLEVGSGVSELTVQSEVVDLEFEREW